MTYLKLLGAASVLSVLAAAAVAAETTTPAPDDAQAEPAIAAEADAEAAAVTFEACYNGGLLKTGAIVEYDVRRTTSNSSATANFVYSVGKPVKFNGQTAVEKKIKITHPLGTETGSEYWTVKSGVISSLGLKSANATITYTPAEKSPIALKAKSPVKQTYTAESKANGQTQYGTVKSTIEFNGVETLKTPVGNVKTCKLTKKVVITPKGSSQVVSTLTLTQWFAREGKYRGFPLKASYAGSDFGQSYNYTLSVIKVKKFAVGK